MGRRNFSKSFLPILFFSILSHMLWCFIQTSRNIAWGNNRSVNPDFGIIIAPSIEIPNKQMPMELGIAPLSNSRKYKFIPANIIKGPAIINQKAAILSSLLARTSLKSPFFKNCNHFRLYNIGVKVTRVCKIPVAISRTPCMPSISTSLKHIFLTYRDISVTRPHSLADL